MSGKRCSLPRSGRLRQTIPSTSCLGRLLGLALAVLLQQSAGWSPTSAEPLTEPLESGQFPAQLDPKCD